MFDHFAWTFWGNCLRTDTLSRTIFLKEGVRDSHNPLYCPLEQTTRKGTQRQTWAFSGLCHLQSCVLSPLFVMHVWWTGGEILKVVLSEKPTISENPFVRAPITSGQVEGWCKLCCVNWFELLIYLREVIPSHSAMSSNRSTFGPIWVALLDLEIPTLCSIAWTLNLGVPTTWVPCFPTYSLLTT